MNEPAVTLLKTLLDATAARQTVLANNVANANTPGFTRSDVPFREALAKAIGARDPNAVARVRPEVRPDRPAPPRPDGNNVSLQKELGMMAQNRLLYDISTLALSSKYARLRAAIRGQ
jgi:flagellar basal-body rod protein FlgB